MALASQASLWAALNQDLRTRLEPDQLPPWGAPRPPANSGPAAPHRSAPASSPAWAPPLIHRPAATSRRSVTLDMRFAEWACFETACRGCPLRSRCATAKDDRNLTLPPSWAVSTPCQGPRQSRVPGGLCIRSPSPTLRWIALQAPHHGRKRPNRNGRACARQR